jgi:hypothetical protein
MSKSSTATAIIAAIIADEMGVKPSRTVRQVRALATLATLVRDVAPRKGSEGKRPVAQAMADWETPLSHGPVSWGYVVQGSPKRVISLPDDRPEYWATLQGLTLLGHVRNSFAKQVGTWFDYRWGGSVSRISPAAVVLRYIRRFPIPQDRIEVSFREETVVGVQYTYYCSVAEDLHKVGFPLEGSARHVVERLREIYANEWRD